MPGPHRKEVHILAGFTLATAALFGSIAVGKGIADSGHHRIRKGDPKIVSAPTPRVTGPAVLPPTTTVPEHHPDPADLVLTLPAIAGKLGCKDVAAFHVQKGDSVARILIRNGHFSTDEVNEIFDAKPELKSEVVRVNTTAAIDCP